MEIGYNLQVFLYSLWLGEMSSDASVILNYENISEATINRLSLYSRLLASLVIEGVTVVSSKELSERTDFTATQIRRDLAYFGQFGKRGIGYEVAALKGAVDKILGVHTPKSCTYRGR